MSLLPRVDLLTKQIEDRHIQDDKQGTIHFSDSFKANTLREESWPEGQLPKELIPDAKVTAKPPRPHVSEKDISKEEKHLETADQMQNPLNLVSDYRKKGNNFYLIFQRKHLVNPKQWPAF